MVHSLNGICRQIMERIGGFLRESHPPLKQRSKGSRVNRNAIDVTTKPIDKRVYPTLIENGLK